MTSLRTAHRIEHRIRPADRNDLPRLRDIAAEAWPGDNLDLAALQDEQALFVAEWRIAIDGFIVLLPLHQSMLVHRLAVAGEMRGRGLGGWLLDFAAQHARGAGHAAIEVQLAEDRTGDIAWLLRHGFARARQTSNRALLRRAAA
ncbi:GNAT family N-acetyltransferase [Ferrovibrio sp.]|uniref:GNAT family N-acetyltransferase n=1 Tax=Ferrovibrio sp. TaxID=1917215 RepID=UPI00311E4C12